MTPPRLRPGDTVAIPAPAGPVPREGFEAGVEILAQRYKVVYDETLFERTGFLAGSDERRANEVNQYLADPDVRAIICARGGYGVMRILDRLDAGALRRDPKILVGFSDITALLAWAVAEAQVKPIHGPMPVQLPRLPRGDVDWLFRLLENPAAPGEIPVKLDRLGGRGGGTVEGRLVGGNLEIISRLIGTPYELDMGAGVLFLEEVGERPYRVDRMLTQLHLAESLAGVRAVAIGEFTRCNEPDNAPPSVTDVIDERLTALDLPGLAGLPIGHGERNLALPLGAMCAVDLAAGRIVIEEGAVA